MKGGGLKFQLSDTTQTGRKRFQKITKSAAPMILPSCRQIGSRRQHNSENTPRRRTSSEKPQLGQKHCTPPRDKRNRQSYISPPGEQKCSGRNCRHSLTLINEKTPYAPTRGWSVLSTTRYSQTYVCQCDAGERKRSFLKPS